MAFRPWCIGFYYPVRLVVAEGWDLPRTGYQCHTTMQIRELVLDSHHTEELQQHTISHQGVNMW